jgi:hypothetical protein
MQADDRDDRDFKCDADPSRAFTRSIMGCCCRAWDKLSKSGASGAFVAPAKTYRRRPGSILRLVGQAFCRNSSTASKASKSLCTIQPIEDSFWCLLDRLTASKSSKDPERAC